MKIRISEHAVKRYRERIGPLPKDEMLSRMELFSRLFSADPRHVRKLLKGKRTTYIPLDDCFLVFDHETMVTVLERKVA